MNRSLTTLALLFAMQVAAILAAPVGVLCVSEGGHIAFEAVPDDCCDRDAHAAERGEGAVVHAVGSDCCGPCTDLDLLAPPPVIPRADQDVAAAPEPSWTPVAPVPAFASTLRQVVLTAHAERRVLRPTVASTSLRTVVLTC